MAIELEMEYFAWRGEPITDIRAWATERGERMVTYHAERTIPDVRTGGLVTETRDGSMPESFWSGLASMHGWHYTETGRV